MSKPTLFQSIFNKPSRKYATFSQSTTAAQSTAKPISYADPTSDLALPLIVIDSETETEKPSVSRADSVRLSLDNTSRYSIVTSQLPYGLDPPSDDTSPARRNSFQSSASSSKQRPKLSKDLWPSSNTPVSVRDTSSPVPPPPERQVPMPSTALTPLKQLPPPSTDESPHTRVHRSHDSPQHRQANSDSDNDDDDDVFFTPKSSPETSPFGSITTKSEPALVPSAPWLEEAPTTDTSAATTTGIVSAPRQTHRVSWSDEVILNVTHLQPASVSASASSSVTDLSDQDSDFGFNNSSYAPSESTAPTSVPSSSSNYKPSAQVVTRSSSQKRRSNPSSIASSTSTADQDDWAKDVRWLVKPESMGGPAARSWTHSTANSSRSSSIAGDFEQAPSPVRRRSLNAPADYLRDAYVPQKRPKSIHSTPKRSSTNSVLSASSSGSATRTPRYRPPPPVQAAPVDPRLVRMSAVLEVDLDEDGNEVIVGTARPEVLHRHIAASTERLTRRKSSARERSRTSSDPSFDVAERAQSPIQRALSVRSKSSSTATSTSYKTVGLATTLQVSSGGEGLNQNGYTSLVLPRAAYTPGKNPISNEVDLTRSGLAQTTMSTISIIKHAASPANMPKRRLSLFSSRSSSTPKGKERTPSLGLAFTSNTPPPNKLPSSSILVQVHATALSSLDHLLVTHHASTSSGYGYVPGRSFVGKVVEAGWEISHLGKGDWVVGLMEMGTRMGSLAEFVVVDRKRVTRIPNPTQQGGAGMERMAMLPLVGVPALRAARTVPKILASEEEEEDREKTYNATSTRPKLTRSLSSFVDQPKEKKRVLVLGAQSAIGTMTVVYLKSMGLIVTAHLLATQSHEIFERTIGKDEMMEAVVDDDVERVLGRMPDKRFRLVVDTVGGKGVWKAAKRVLDPNGGQFTTTMGDTPSLIPTRQLHIKANMRSLRHAFSRGKDNLAVGYAWICPAVDVDHDGEDVRDTLKAVVELAVVKGVGWPAVEKVVMFERTPDETFDEGEMRPVVVKIVG